MLPDSFGDGLDFAIPEMGVAKRRAHIGMAKQPGYRWAETDLDRLSNSVVRLVDEGRLDEADAACEKLRTRYLEVVDWLMPCMRLSHSPAAPGNAA